MNIFNSKIRKLPIKIPQKEGYNYEYDDNSKLFFINVPNGELIYCENFFNKRTSDLAIEYFLKNENDLDWKNTHWRNFEKDKLSTIKFKNILWQHNQIKIFGKDIFLPRYSAWYGDSHTTYTYSGLTLHPKPWNSGLMYIKQQIDKIAKVHFNSVLMNWYRDGKDYINWHSDAERELGKNPVIGSINFGATRRFLIRQIHNKKEQIEIPLKNGTLLIMKGALQHYWQHSIPKEKKVEDIRINLTFRVVRF